MGAVVEGVPTTCQTPLSGLLLYARFFLQPWPLSFLKKFEEPAKHAVPPSESVGFVNVAIIACM
jgi:hypothetical protein